MVELNRFIIFFAHKLFLELKQCVSVYEHKLNVLTIYLFPDLSTLIEM